MNSKDEQMKQIQKLIVEFVKQFGPSSGKQLLNITDYIAKPVLQALVDGEHVGRLELLRENADNDENMYQNGSYTRNVKWGQEEIPIKMKRIRGENQDSQIIPKYQRIIHDKFILDVLSLASTRLSNNEIADQITSMYGFKVSPSVISNCIQTVQDEMRDWHERPL